MVPPIVLNFLQDLPICQSGKLKLILFKGFIFENDIRGSRETVNLDVENELREAMSDTVREEGKFIS